MQNASWKELADFINTKMTEEQQNQCVTICDTDNDEYYALSEITNRDTEGVLDEGHYYLIPVI